MPRRRHCQRGFLFGENFELRAQESVSSRQGTLWLQRGPSWQCLRMSSTSAKELPFNIRAFGATGDAKHHRLAPPYRQERCHCGRVIHDLYPGSIDRGGTLDHKLQFVIYRRQYADAPARSTSPKAIAPSRRPFSPPDRVSSPGRGHAGERGNGTGGDPC